LEDNSVKPTQKKIDQVKSSAGPAKELRPDVIACHPYFYF
jgi:hypothetical protein